MSNETTLVEFIKFEEAIIIKWRKAINTFMEKEYGFILRFLPEIEGEHD